MRYDFNFGKLNPASTKWSRGTGPFRIAILGDFSGAANRGRLDTGDALAAHKPFRVDVDNLDDLVERFGIKLRLPLGSDSMSVELELESMDDFHPDELYDKLEMFEELSGLRKRLNNSSMFAAAAAEVQSWLEDDLPEITKPSKPRGASIPSGKLSDFSALMGRPTSSSSEDADVEDLIRGIVSPYVTAEADPRQEAMVAAVDRALSEAMRGVLHHPDFQSLESLWRGVELLVRNLETSTQLQIVLYDVTAEEFAADLSGCESLEDSGLFKLLIEQPSLDAQQGALSLILGNYTFEQTPPHAELLARMAKLCAVGQVPFVAAIGNDCLKKQNPDEIHPLVQQSWDALRDLPEAIYLGLTVPRFMLRWPYGKKTEPIDPFEFEEFTAHSGLRGMLWGNSAFLVGLLLGQTVSQQGLSSMKLGSILTVGDMPFYYYTDQYGDQVALPCTERLLNERLTAHVTTQRMIPVLSIQGRPEVRVGGFLSLAGKDLAGPWAPVEIDLTASSAASSPVSGKTEPAVTSAPAAATAPEHTEPEQTAPQPAETEPMSAATSPAETADTVDAAESSEAAEPVAADTDAGSVDDELDALLASLEADSEPEEPASEDDIDPELAALLAEL